MKELTKEKVDDIIKLKWGSLVTDPHGPTFTSDAALGKVFRVSASKIRQLYKERFEEFRRKGLSLMERLRLPARNLGRQRWGLRFLRPHEIQWLTSG